MPKTFLRVILMGLIMLISLAACNRPTAGPGVESPGTQAVEQPGEAPQAPPAETPEAVVVRSQEVCLTPDDVALAYINEAGGYCLLIPAEFEITQDSGLDIFVVGPRLATFGMDALVLAFEFSVVGAPGGAGTFDAQAWGAQLASEHGAAGFEVGVEPYSLREIGLEGVRVGPLPGMAGGEAMIFRTNDTLYSITIYPDAQGSPDYAEQIQGLWDRISDSTRFFTPVETDITYSTEVEVCPTQQSGTRYIANFSEGWCALIPDTWEVDSAFDFPGRFVGGPRIGDFWPGQPPFANVVIGYSGPALDFTLEQQVEGRKLANGRPDLVSRTDTSIGSYPAVILDTQDGPIPEMVAMIHANGNMYTVLGTPFDEVNFPEAQESLRTAWDMVIQTIQFFEPYR